MPEQTPETEAALNRRLIDLTKMFDSVAIDMVTSLTLPAALVDLMLRKIDKQRRDLEDAKYDVANLKRQVEQLKNRWQSVTVIGPVGQSYGVASNSGGELTICSRVPGKDDWEHGVRPHKDSWLTILGGNRAYTVTVDKLPEVPPDKPTGRG